MSAYTTQADITSFLNGQDIVPFLDDDRDGSADTGLLATIISNAGTKIDGRLAGIYTVPFTGTIPPRVKDAANVIVCWSLYQRRLTPSEKNPFAEEYKMVLEDLTRIGSGELNLDSTVTRAFSPGVIVGAPVVVSSTMM